MKKFLTRLELGEQVFQAIKKELQSRGFALFEPHFDPQYPISLRAIHNIRKGQFRVETLNLLPGIEVFETFTLRSPWQLETTEEREKRLQKMRVKTKERIANETPEQREKRRMEKRRYMRKKRNNETPEQREKRLEQSRKYQKIYLESETPEKREKRLAKLRENYYNYYKKK